MIFNIQKTVGMDYDRKQIFPLYCIKYPNKRIPNFVLKV